jgi:hypothetical protein
MESTANNTGLSAILKELEEAVVNAGKVPLTNKVMVSEDIILDCVERIYTALPEEVKHAQRVLEQSDKLLESVEGQGQRIINDAKEQAALMTQESAVYQEAAKRAGDMIAQAEEAALQLRRDSLYYCDDVLEQLEHTLEKMIVSIHKNRDDLKKFSYYENKDGTVAAEE